MDVHVLPDRPDATLMQQAEKNVIALSGGWVVAWGEVCEALVNRFTALDPGKDLVLDLSKVSLIDTSGAWLFNRLVHLGKERGCTVEISGANPKYLELMKAISKAEGQIFIQPKKRLGFVDMLEILGQRTRSAALDFVSLISILGGLATVLVAVLAKPSRIRPVSIAVQFQRCCIGAVPIIMLMSFLIGGIIAQQGGFYLKQFGADIFVVDLSGILVLREIGVILTAIMVAGRSGSAFTAELGSMKMREEIDALRTMGLRVTEVLVLPRLLALMVGLPILVFLANIAALIGAGLVCWWYLGITPTSYMTQLQIAITPETLMVGLVKAPFMALIIGLIACIEGMKTDGSSESLGIHTTLSVVKAIFLVIVVDGAFAIFFASVGV
ncbi:ABC transporter permease [Flexibacterium corallicola]|uniref:ABC transporter permease n=1 Tax=Flexibacterium corallicola TaxID=3037259 RepID=UPI00286F8F24|nr:ABC transporter permease [Pseudovibrio sp. M1P-2-3]